MEVGMKPEKVNHYLNKRREREARLAALEEEGGDGSERQIPNRSPSSEESFTILFSETSDEKEVITSGHSSKTKHKKNDDNVQPGDIGKSGKTASRNMKFLIPTLATLSGQPRVRIGHPSLDNFHLLFPSSRVWSTREQFLSTRAWSALTPSDI